MEKERVMRAGIAETGTAVSPFTRSIGSTGGWKRILPGIGRCFAGFFARTQEGADSALRIEEKLLLGPKKMLYLVSCREKELLVAAGADAIVSLTELSSAEAAHPARASLARMQKRERLP